MADLFYMAMIMDYEEKYNYVLGRAERLKKSCSLPYIKDWVDNVFPELRESEDERIRKGLIKAVSGTLKGNTLFGTDVTREEALAWLEKQSEKDKLIKELGVYKVKYTQEVLSQQLEKQVPKSQGKVLKDPYITPNKEFFQFIYNRLIYVHKENPNTDYMLSLKERISNMYYLEQSKSTFKASNWYVSKVDGKIHDMTYTPKNKDEQVNWTEEDEPIG